MASLLPGNPARDSSTAQDNETEEMGDIEDNFEEITSKRKSKKRKTRASIESLGAQESDSNTSYVEARTNPSTPHKFQNLKLLIVPIDSKKSITKINPMKIAQQLDRITKNDSVRSIKPVRNGILVDCKHIKQYNLLSQIQEIENTPVKIQKRQTLVKGVIKGVSTDIEEPDIVKELTAYKVTYAKRMTRKSSDKKDNIPLKTVILTFDSKQLPKDITLWYQKFEVRQYIPPVPRCYNCQRMGHTAGICQSKQRCVRCGESHSFEECNKKEQPKCLRCNGNHSAAYDGCIEIQKAKQIQNIRFTEKISYALAAKKFSESSKRPESTSNRPSDAHPSPDIPLSGPNTTGKGTYPHPTPEGRPLPQTTAPSRERFSVTPSTPQQNVTVPPSTSNEQTIKPSISHKAQGEPQSNNFITRVENEKIIAFIVKIANICINEHSQINLLTDLTAVVQSFFNIPEIDQQKIDSYIH